MNIIKKRKKFVKCSKKKVNGFSIDSSENIEKHDDTEQDNSEVQEESVLSLTKDALKGALDDLVNRQDEILSIIESERGLRSVKITIEVEPCEIVNYTIEKNYNPTYYMKKAKNEQP